MARAGRPKSVGDRYPSGQLKPKLDSGTVELRQHRSLALGCAATSDAGRDTRASTALGQLFFHHLIDSSQHFGGNRYRNLYFVASGIRPSSNSCLAKLQAGGGGGRVSAYDADPEAAAILRQDYLCLRRSLTYDLGRLIDFVVIDDHMPQFYELPRLRSGLDILHRFFTP